MAIESLSRTELLAIVSKLPVDVDGNPVVPYVDRVTGPDGQSCWIADLHYASYYPVDHPKGPAATVLISRCRLVLKK